LVIVVIWYKLSPVLFYPLLTLFPTFPDIPLYLHLKSHNFNLPKRPLKKPPKPLMNQFRPITIDINLNNVAFILIPNLKLFFLVEPKILLLPKMYKKSSTMHPTSSKYRWVVLNLRFNFGDVVITFFSSIRTREGWINLSIFSTPDFHLIMRCLHVKHHKNFLHASTTYPSYRHYHLRPRSCTDFDKCTFFSSFLTKFISDVCRNATVYNRYSSLQN